MDSTTTYPTVAAVIAADFETLSGWADKLPPPQTDVERTVVRRIKARQHEMASSELRRKAPDIADTINSVSDMVEKLTGKKFPRF